MGVTLSRRGSHKTAKRKRKGRRKTDVYCDGATAEPFDSQTYPKVPFEDRNIEVEKKNEELALKNKKIEEQELMLQECRRKIESLEKIRAKILEPEEENENLRASVKKVETGSPNVAKPSVNVCDVSTCTEPLGADEKRKQTTESATNTDTESSISPNYSSNTNIYFKDSNIQIGNNNTVKTIVNTEGQRNDQTANERNINDAQLRVHRLLVELKNEKEKVKILRRQLEDMEASQTKTLEMSLPFRTADFSLFKHLRYL